MTPGTLATARRGVGVTAALAALSCVAGLLLGGVVLPAAGVIGIAARDAAQTFSALPVPALGQLPSRSAILDSSGRLLAYYYPDNIDRVPVSYRQIAPVMRTATVAIEDARFWQHGALDLRGTFRALLSDLAGGSVQGGSTLAQQYVKNALLLTATSSTQQQAAQTDSAARKIRELRMAAQVEHEMSRPELLAAYLSVAYFANHAYGIQAAAERYFSTSARRLDLVQSALLAGLVENPAGYDPVRHPAAARARRDVVLARMAQLGYITAGRAAAAQRSPLGLRLSGPAQGGCAGGAAAAAWFCDYVLAVLRTDPAYAAAYRAMTTVGGLTIRTTMSRPDQLAAQHAVSFLLPPPPSPYNPGGNAAAEVLIQPGTGWIRAIAVDRRYGQSRALGQDSIDYAADTRDDGGLGVQTGSSSKLFTLLAALREGMPFGYRAHVVSPATISGYTSCRGQAGPFLVSNAEGPGSGTYTLYTGTTQSINVFYAQLERKVGLCRVVRTAVSLGVHRADGRSLLAGVGRPGSPGYQPPADDLPSFTLGSVSVSPMTMAAAYATVAARGIYCQADRGQLDHHRRRAVTAGAAGRLSPGHPGPGGRCRHAHPAGGADHRDRGGQRRPPGWRLHPAGRQDRDRQRVPVRRLRRVHAPAGRLRLHVQPGRAGQSPDDRGQLLLPRRVRGAGLPGRGIRGERGPDLAGDLRPGQPGQPAGLLRAGAGRQPLLRPRAGYPGPRPGTTAPALIAAWSSHGHAD